MSVGSNYDDALGQLQAAGLDVQALEVGRLVRCKAKGDLGNQRTGWYSLHELRTTQGDVLIVGAYGCWRDGSDPKTGKPLSNKIELGKRDLTSDERAAIRTRIADEKRRAEARRKAKAERAAREAEAMWKMCAETWTPPDGTPTASNDYLQRKGVGAHGVRFSPTKGNLVIPLHDASGKIHGLQVIYSDPAVKKKKGRDKDFWPAGLAKRGHYFLIGSPTWVVLIAEGYATAASIHEATGLPVAVAWDAGNILPVAQALKKRYRNVKILIAADDDYLGRCRACGKYTPVAEEACQHCGEPHGKANTGINAASTAALAVGGEWVAPQFTDRGTRKITDFNDLHASEGLQAVRAQLETRLDELKWRPAEFAAPATTTGGGGGSVDLQPISSIDELHQRFTLVYGHNSTVFDGQEHILLKLADMRDACTRRELHRDWMESPAKRIVRVDQVGFDPSGSDSKIKCNLWGGWPTTPKSGSCEALLDLLEYLCNHENSGDLFKWVLRWCAYPIQNPGAKLKTSLVLHGPQGVGKNMFFEALMEIYGQYGTVVDQSAVEDKFNDWASKKLLLIADEVVARQELYHTKNKIKGLITGDWIRINPKNVTPYSERNHVNIIFMSNEVQPLVLEQDDRRFAVIWTPEKLAPNFYEDVKEEIDNGGIEALHDYLLNLDLGDFKPWTLPPMTRAKQELIDLSMDSTDRFIKTWMDGDLDPVPVTPCLSSDFYKLYRAYCAQAGIPKYAPSHILLGRAGKHKQLRKHQARHLTSGGKLKRSMFIFPVTHQDAPDDAQRRQWLTECIDNFQTSFRDWKNNNDD